MSLLFGYEVRPAIFEADHPTARAWFASDPWHREKPWTELELDQAAQFWTRGGAYCVELDGDRLAFFRALMPNPSTAQLYAQFAPFQQNRGKKILRGLIKLVPLIEKGLAKSGVESIFFVTTSTKMMKFMVKRLGFSVSISATDDGRRVVSKKLRS